MTSPLPPLQTTGLSPKAAAAAVVAFLLSVLLPAAAAIIANVVANPGLLDAVPAWLRVGVLAALVSLGTLLGAYRARPGAVTLVSSRYGD